MFLLKLVYVFTLSLTLALSAHSTAIERRDANSDMTQYIKIHNDLRKQWNATALIWNTTIANNAQKWANNCSFGGSGAPYMGENISAGYGKKYGLLAALQGWANQNSTWNASNPKASAFTQMVWKSTTQLGCAVQTCNFNSSSGYDAKGNSALYFVCEYWPAGNIVNKGAAKPYAQFSTNVNAHAISSSP
ncbi:hypothetical protein D9758_012945 [Tetrapyrgos nigripes]|uniref:SCP domain-containing protein n=1 Tax=Tetrapyrgos nigripes TaxID=182062 RepID=A0A8H5CKQ5_9AGAR|nr:hypothetical protein D9758_012945 [Tetrapyrgos nigripes]